MSTLEFKVQTDRIQSTQEWIEKKPDASIWIAVKISAGFDQIPQEPTDEHVAALIPWKWGSILKPFEAGSWNPHDAASWSVWAIETKASQGGDPDYPLTPIKTMEMECVSAKISDTQELLGLLNTAIFEIVGASKSSLRFNPPDEETNIKGTVPGFIERLATLPDPIPRASCVHALLSIDPQALHGMDPTKLRFIAVPRLAWAGGSIDASNNADPKRVTSVNGRELEAWIFEGAGYSYRVQMVPSLEKERMVAKPDKGRLIDLFDQTIVVKGGEDAYLYTLPTAEAVAELPQRLADAIDPLARIRSVLPRIAAEWLNSKHEDAAQRRDTLATNLKSFKKTLDLIAIQILGQRFDLVGRFEVPMYEALKENMAENEGKPHKQFAGYWNLAPHNFPETKKITAALRITEGEISNRNTGLNVSPFSENYLKMLFGLGNFSAQIEIPSDTEILKSFWSITPHDSDPNNERYFRYFEFSEGIQDQEDGHIVLKLEPRLILNFIDTKFIDNSDPFAEISFEAVRSNCALCFAAPFIEGIVAGRTNWYGAHTPNNDTLHQRFKDSVSMLLWGEDAKPGIYRTLAGANPIPDADDPDKLITKLLNEILEEASKEAVKIATRIGFRADPFDRITTLPLPMALQVDQIQTFPRTTDVWTRLSGYGLLAARTGYPGRTEEEAKETVTDFVSLNPASLYIGGLADQPKEENVEQIEKGKLIKGLLADNSTERDFVDPWPYSPGDGVGVSDAIAEFANSWTTAPMPGDALVDQSGSLTGVAAARIVAGPPPKPVKNREGRGTVDPLPTFAFGYSYEVLGHLVSQGGVLAPFLRDEENPYVFAEKFSFSSLKEELRAILVNYKRTTGIGTPTISHDRPPSNIKVDLLASELPKRSPPIRLSSTGLRINYDHESGGTLIDWPGVEKSALRFEFVTFNSSDVAETMEIIFSDENAPFQKIDLTLSPNKKTESWWRIDVDKSGKINVQSKILDSLAEEQLRQDFGVGWESKSQLEIKNPTGEEGVYLTLKCLNSSSRLLIEPLRVVPIVGEVGASIDELSGVSATRHTKTNKSDPVLLDGLPRDLSNQVISRSLKAKIAGPSIDRHTWERWTNCALFTTPKDDKSRKLRESVINDLKKQQSKLSAADGRGAEQELPDPAVTALWVELWEIFPARRMVGEPILSMQNPLLRPDITVNMTVDRDSDAEIQLNAGSASAKLRSGCVYELHVRAAIDADEKPFDNLRPNKDKLGKAVLESCSFGTHAGKDWILGQAAILTVEVATSELPNIESLSNKVLRGAPVSGGRAIDLVLPQDAISTKALAADIRRTLRYCVSAGLVPQRWSWRGTPRAPSKKEAFDDRAPTDVGRLEFGTLRAAHALTASGTGMTANAQTPVIVTRNLDWRGGWNVWRFKVILTSRYTPLFQQKSDAEKSINGQEQEWIPHYEFDADNGRAITRPPFALILPLTEAEENSIAQVPPLLALFYGPMHQNDHFGDMISVSVDVARHPMPALADGKSAIEHMKFLPEVGPDPIRTGFGHSGEAIPLKIEGPIGYSFDRDRTAGLFNNSGFIVTPMTEILAPWAMIKFKFRRQEDPAGLDTNRLNEINQSKFAISGVLPGEDGKPDIRHEGIVFRWSKLMGEGEGEVKIKMVDSIDATDLPSGHWVNLKVTVKSGTFEENFSKKLTIQSWVLRKGEQNEFENLWSVDEKSPNAGWAELKMPKDVDGAFDLQIIVSTRPKPTEGTYWRAAGEVAIQSRISDGNSNDSTRSWLSLFSLPIEAAGETILLEEDASVDFITSGNLEKGFEVLPIRLSDYSASTWCQFTVPSSSFSAEIMVKVNENYVGKVTKISMNELRLFKSNDTNWEGIWLTNIDGDPLTLLPENKGTEPEQADVTKSSVTELLFAIVTELSYDSLRIPSERPLMVLPLKVNSSKMVCGDPIWPNQAKMTPKMLNGRSGRWRIMRVLVRNLAGQENLLNSLEDLFKESLSPDEDATINPDDAKGIVLSVSRPSKWSFQ